MAHPLRGAPATMPARSPAAEACADDAASVRLNMRVGGPRGTDPMLELLVNPEGLR